MTSSATEAVEHYKRKLLRHLDDADVVLYCLKKLDTTAVTIEILQDTGVGKTVNTLKKKSDYPAIGEAARKLVNKWKEMVEREVNDDSEQNGDHDEVESPGLNHDDEDEKPPKLKAVSPSRHKKRKKEKKEKSRDRDRGHDKSKSSKGSSSQNNHDFFAAALNAAGDSRPPSKHHHKSSSSKHSNSNSFSNGHTEEPSSSAANIVIPSDVNPNYRPTPSFKRSDSHIHRAANGIASKMTDDEALSAMMAFSKSGRGRTSVYSGRKTSAFSKDEKFPSLKDLCIVVLQDNVDLIDECGDADYTMMKPVLQRARPDDLMRIENCNPKFMEDTGELWEKHCKRHFSKEKRQEFESWREMYERCTEERESKLNQLQAKMQNSYKDIKSNTSQTRLAYVDVVAKPPRNIKKAQEKNGTGLAIGASLDLVKNKRARTAASAGSGSSAPKKPKIAPMMAKTLKMARGLKSGFRR